jgi:hypothetical protein
MGERERSLLRRFLVGWSSHLPPTLRDANFVEVLEDGLDGLRFERWTALDRSQGEFLDDDSWVAVLVGSDGKVVALIDRVPPSHGEGRSRFATIVHHHRQSTETTVGVHVDPTRWACGVLRSIAQLDDSSGEVIRLFWDEPIGPFWHLSRTPDGRYEIHLEDVRLDSDLRVRLEAWCDAMSVDVWSVGAYKTHASDSGAFDAEAVRLLCELQRRRQPKGYRVVLTYTDRGVVFGPWDAPR